MKLAEQQARAIYDVESFSIGDAVRVRTWSVPAWGAQSPIVWRQKLTITDIVGDSIWCGHREFSAFELIHAGMSY